MSGEFFLKSKLNGNVIDIRGADRNNGAGLISWPQKESGTENQRWSLVDAGGGFFYIRSALNGNVIDIYGGDRNPAVRLISWPTNSPKSDNQLWSLVPAGNGYYYIKSKLNGFVIDIRGGDRNNGAELISYPVNNPQSDNQLWALVAADTLRPVATPSAGFTGSQTIAIPPGKLAFVVATAQSSGVQTVTIKNSAGATVFTASGKSSSGGALTVIGQGNFVSAGEGSHTIEMTGNAGLLRAAQAIVYQNEPYITTYVFGTNDGGVQAGDRDFNDLVVTIQVFRTAG